MKKLLWVFVIMTLSVACSKEVTIDSLTGFEYVDLGLSVKWASCNLGADKPEKRGCYYQWGGLQDVTEVSINLNWTNCPYHNYRNDYYRSGWMKYIPSGKPGYWLGEDGPDNKIVLEPGDDAAHVNMGGRWRIPTTTEFTELYANCTCEWTTLNGVRGRKFTSKINGNSIFLPAAGYRLGKIHRMSGVVGIYWTLNLSVNEPECAYCYIFDSNSVYNAGYYRSDGLSVRPVLE